VIGPDELHDLLHAHAATVEPIPHLAELGAALTTVERHRRTRAVVSTTIVAVAVAAAMTALRAIDTHPSHIDTAPATQRVVLAPDVSVATSTTVVVAPSTVPATAATVASPPPTAQPAPPPTTASPTAAPAPAPSGPHNPTGSVLTFRAASVSDLSSADPPAADYFGVAPPGSHVAATSQYGSAATQADADGRWSLHVPMPDAPVGQRIRVVLSAPPLPSLTFNFTHTAR